jgi:hypothetical protein
VGRRRRAPSPLTVGLDQAHAGEPACVAGDQPWCPVHLDQSHFHCGSTTRRNPQQEPANRRTTDDGTQRGADPSTAVGQHNGVLAQHGLQSVEVAAGASRQQPPRQVSMSLPAGSKPPTLLGQVGAGPAVQLPTVIRGDVEHPGQFVISVVEHPA